MNDKLAAELQALRIAVRMAKLELGSHGACPACFNAYTLLTRAADALEPSGDVVERVERVARVARVARAISIAMFGYDCIPHDTELCRASESRVGTVMRAAIAALGASHAE